MQSRKLATGSAIALAIGLTGCSSSFLESKKIDYKSAGTAPVLKSLEVPPDLTTPSRDERFTVPDIDPKGVATFSAYSAERGGAAQASAAPAAAPQVAPASIDKMRIVRSGSQRWLVIQGNADALWPQVRISGRKTVFC
jgi:outer membrane protein assembly factor BamC